MRVPVLADVPAAARHSGGDGPYRLIVGDQPRIEVD